MRVVIDGQRAKLDTRRMLGEGGEATVVPTTLRGRRLAVKIFKADPERRLDKVRALMAVTGQLGAIATLPRALVLDEATGSFIGYAMEALDQGFDPVALLAKDSYRDGAGLSMGRTLALLGALGAALSELHRSGIVVGDLNDQNELIRPADGAVRFIDTDSFQFATRPCDVSTEAYLDPLLYGPDLLAPCATARGEPRWFGRGSDWYAFGILVFRALTGIHPYGGADVARTALPARARAGKSVLAGDIVVPARVRHRIDALPSALRDRLAGCFERADRRPFEWQSLSDARLYRTRHDCGLELGDEGRPCPRCTKYVAAPSGTVQARTLCSSAGRFFAVAADANRFAALAREDEEIVAFFGAQTGAPSRRRVALATEPGTTGFISTTHAIAAHGGRLDVIDLTTGEVVLETATEVAFGRPALALRGSVLHRIARGTLLEVDLSSGDERPIATVVSEQTVLWPAGAGVVAVTQILGRRTYQWITSRAATELEVAPLRQGQASIDEWLAADAERAVLVRSTREAGIDWIRTDHFDAFGHRHHTQEERVEDRVGGAALRGAVFASSKVLVATDAGLARHVASGAPPSLFSQTEPWVVSEAPLAIGCGGVVAAVGGSVHVLRLASPS